MSTEFDKKALKDEELDKVSGGYIILPPTAPPRSPASRTSPVAQKMRPSAPPPPAPGGVEPC